MSLRVWLPLDGTLENKGLSQVTATNSGATVNSAGKIGSCYQNDSAGDGIVLTDYMTELKTYSTYSMCAWVYMSSTASSHSSTILSSGNWNSSNGNLCFGFYSYSDGYAYLLIPQMAGWNANAILLPQKIQLNTWYHVTVTYNGTVTTAYINGEQVGTKNAGGICQNSNTNNLKIGAATYTNSFTLKGKYNDIRIYDHCLSPKEVKEISQGLVLHYKLDEKIENLLPYNLTTDNYDIINYSNRTPGTISNEVYHVDGYQSETAADTSFGIRSKTFITLVTDTDYYLSFYCKCKAAGILYFATSDQGHTGLMDSSNTYYRPTSQFTLGTEYDGFVVLKLHTGSDTQYKIYIGFDGPNIWGVGSFMEFKHIALTTQKPNVPIIQRQNLLPVSAQRMTVAGTTSSNEYMNLCSILSIVDAYGLVPYTISFEIKSAIPHGFSVYGSYGNNPKYSYTASSVNATTEWKRFSYTFTPRLNNESGTWTGVSVYGTYGSGAIPSVRNVRLELANNMIYDYSGYGNDGTITGEVEVSSSTPRYTNSTAFTNTSYIRVMNRPNDFLPKDEITVNLWAKWSTWGNPISCTEGGGWNIEQNSTGLRFPVYSGGYKIAQSTFAPASHLNEWHMITGTFDADYVKIYIDGEVAGSLASGGNSITYYNNYLFISAEAGGNSTTPATSTFVGDISDVRIYATALSDEDIKELYNTPTNIDNHGNMHTFEFVEDEVTDEQILKTGIVKTDNFIEFNDKLKVLADGSVFLQILHHNNPASNLFTVNNCWLNNTTNLYSTLSLLKESGWFTSLSEYEFLICEKLTNTGTESQYRWKQTSNPSTSSTLSGYSVISGSPARPCGLMNKGTYAAMHNGSAWWVACGSYTAFQGGIPGVAGIVTTGYLDLYIRIPDEILKGTLSDFLKMYKKSIIGNQMIEK